MAKIKMVCYRDIFKVISDIIHPEAVDRFKLYANLKEVREGWCLTLEQMNELIDILEESIQEGVYWNLVPNKDINLIISEPNHKTFKRLVHNILNIEIADSEKVLNIIPSVKFETSPSTSFGGDLMIDYNYDSQFYDLTNYNNKTIKLTSTNDFDPLELSFTDFYINSPDASIPWDFNVNIDVKLNGKTIAEKASVGEIHPAFPRGSIETILISNNDLKNLSAHNTLNYNAIFTKLSPMAIPFSQNMTMTLDDHLGGLYAITCNYGFNGETRGHALSDFLGLTSDGTPIKVVSSKDTTMMVPNTYINEISINILQTSGQYTDKKILISGYLPGSGLTEERVGYLNSSNNFDLTLIFKFTKDIKLTEGYKIISSFAIKLSNN